MGKASSYQGLSFRKRLSGLFEHLPNLRNKTRKKTLPNEVTPQGLRPVHKELNLALSWTIVNGVELLGHKIIVCKLYLQDLTPRIYSSIGIVIEILSPFTHEVGNWIVGIM